MNQHRRIAILIFGPILILIVAVSLSRAFHRSSVAIEENEVVSASWSTLQDDRAAATDKLLSEKCDLKAEEVRKKLGEHGRVIVRAPFIVAGDMSEEQLDNWHRQTIAPSARGMANEYFSRAPSEPITIFLFSNTDSYNAWANELFGDRGISVYGYYKPTFRTLVMNISTGGGTLVHELTHALIAFDFATVPDWFNEGFASLHEQCQFEKKDDKLLIRGLTNWRLAGLKQAIEKKQLGSLRDLVESDDFRGKNEGLNYAQARYLCLYLQQKGQLADFYREFRDNFESDPRGLKTLHKLLGTNRSWDEIDADYQKWVMTLDFRAN